MILFYVEIDECVSSPCENNGTCEDLVNRFRCSCPVNYYGTTCGRQRYEIIDVIIGDNTTGKLPFW